MYYIYSDTVYPGAMKRLIDQLIGQDRREDNPYTEQFSDDTQSSHHQLQPNRRNYSTCVLKATPEILCHRMHVNVQKVKNSTHTNNILYRTFKQQLITDGTVQWRQRSEFQDVVITGDYNPGTGLLKPLSYVHITCTSTSNGETSLLKCTCQIYNTIKCASLSNIELLDEEDAVLDEHITCMHCRFYEEHLHQKSWNLYNITSFTAIDYQVKESLPTINNPVVVLGTPMQAGTTKLPVISEEDVALVHLNFHSTNSRFANCQKGGV